MYDREANPFYVSSRNAEVLSQRLTDIFLSIFSLDSATPSLRSQEGEEAAKEEPTPAFSPSFPTPHKVNSRSKSLLPSVLLKEEISKLKELKNSSHPLIKQKVANLFSSPSFLTDEVEKETKEVEEIQEKVKKLQRTAEVKERFYQVLSQGEREAQQAKAVYGVLLRREAELAESAEFVRLKEEELKHVSQSH